jgi:orotate phosphoribosyltransferase-like protein
MLTELADSTKLRHLILNLKGMSKAQLPVRLTVVYQTARWMTERADKGMHTSFPEQKTQIIFGEKKKKTNVCAGCL